MGPSKVPGVPGNSIGISLARDGARKPVYTQGRGTGLG